MLWDLYCRVIDNHGDVGVCWRLAADLAARGETVRVWIDDASALSWMAPAGARGVTVQPWPGADVAAEPGDVVIEAFGCDLPPAVVRRMAERRPAPAWINLEYLSAEDYVERSHRLPSPQTVGLRKWFYYPGFTARTGGLIRERDLAARQRAFDARAWLAGRGLPRRTEAERIVSLFCYEQPALSALIDDLSRRPTLLLATAGHAARQVQDLLGPSLARGELRAALVPALTQFDYDHLLWSSDLNFVRGEDSFVRAQWAGRPFVWQIYPQHDAAHEAKLAAFLGRFLEDAPPGLAAPLGAVWRAWNDPAGVWASLPDAASWRSHTETWRTRLVGQADLATQLAEFVAESR